MAPLQLFVFGLFLAWFVGSGKARALIDALMAPGQSPTSPQTGPSTPLGPVTGTPSIVQNSDGSYDVTIPDINNPIHLHIPGPGPGLPTTTPNEPGVPPVFQN